MNETVVPFTVVSSKATFCALRKAVDNRFFRRDVREEYSSSTLLEGEWGEDPDRPDVRDGGYRGWGPCLRMNPFLIGK